MLAVVAAVLAGAAIATVVLTRSGGVPAGAVSVAAYGARGDGATDDTKAIDRALSAATAAHKALYFPAGTYKVGALAVPRGADLVGAGARSWLSGRLEIAGDSRLRDMELGVKGAALHFVDGASHTAFERVTFTGGGAMSGDGCVVSFESGAPRRTSPSATARSERTRSTATA